MAVIAYLELLNALAVEGAVGEVLPVDLNKNRNLGLFSGGKAPDINSNPKVVVKRLQKVGVQEFHSRKTTVAVARGNWAFTWGDEFSINDVTYFSQFRDIGYRKKEEYDFTRQSLPCQYSPYF